MAMVAATVATNQMRKLNLTKNAVDRSEQIKKGIKKLKGKYSIIGDVRIKGLFIGFDLPFPEYVNRFQLLLAKHSVKSSLSTGATVRFLPPLVITEEDIDFLFESMEKVFMEL